MRLRSVNPTRVLTALKIGNGIVIVVGLHSFNVGDTPGKAAGNSFDRFIVFTFISRVEWTRD